MMKKTLALVFAAFLAQQASAAALCSHVIVPSVQLHVSGEAVTPVVTAEGNLIPIALDVVSEGFYMSEVLPEGNYTLSLKQDDKLLLAESFTIKKTAACYTTAFVKTYDCRIDKEGVTRCAEE